jgi:ATP-dependent exoDNAse (exonuclease V) beta subunit
VWRVVPAVERPRCPAWVVGSLVHSALGAWRFPDNTFPLWAEARARGHGLTDPKRLSDAARRSARILDLFRQSALAAEMQTADVRLHEVPYCLVVDGKVERGIIDALFRREGQWTIVEFKTDEVRKRIALKDLIKEKGYARQAARYSAAVEELVGQRPRVLLCMLNVAGEVCVEAL